MVAFLGMAFAPRLEVYLGSFFLLALVGNSTFPAIHSANAEAVPDSWRARTAGLAAMAWNGGMALGGLGSGAVYAVAPNFVFFLESGFEIAIMVLILALTLPERPRKHARAAAAWRDSPI